MLLKNLMEDRQLDFYQPLLSVRRFSSTAPPEKEEKRKTDNSLHKIPPLPSYKSELKSGPIRNAGTVPFVWELSPGRPKNESRPHNHVIERPPIAPKFPPGRILKTRKQDSDNNTERPVVSKHRGEIPYSSHSVSASNENVTKLDSSKDTTEVESSDSGEGDDAYMDALDTFSRSESFFLNCSVSGISGLEGSDVNTSGNCSTDPQTRDFMMGRFLPAARAMTSETPQYVPRKLPVVREQPRQMMKVRSGDKRPPLRYGPNVVPHYAQEKDGEESVDDYDEHGQLPSKVCGLLPRFCLKSSFCLLNPVPGMSVRTRVPMSPSSRTHGSSSSAGSCSENENEHIRATIYEQRSLGDLQTTGLHEDTSVSNNQSDQLSCPFNPQKLKGSALYRRLQGSGMPPHHNELFRSNFSEQKGFLSNPVEAKNAEATGFSTLFMPSQHYELPRSSFSEQKGVLSIPGEAKNAELTGFSTSKKGLSTFQELLADLSSNGEVDDGSPMIEKTLYVDTVHMVESRIIYSYTSETKGLPDLRGNALNNLEKSRAMEETPLVDSSFKDTENLNVEDKEANIKAAAHNNVDFSVPSLDDKSNQVAMKIQKGFVQYEDITEDLTTSVKSEVPNNVNMDFETQQPPKAEELEKSNGSYFPIPPPLPKSPSDSWLWRTLPSMSSKTPSLRPHFGTGIHPGNQALKTFPVHPKWGTIVITTKEHRQYDLLTSIPES